MVKIIPAILTSDIKEVEEKLNKAEGVIERVQIDIVDGQFAANKTIEPSALEVLDTDLLLDFHLMTKSPSDWVERAVRGGADRIIGQVEMMDDQVDFLGKVGQVGLEVGLALDLPTPVSAIDPTVLTNLDVVLVMSVKAGFGGQKFEEEAIEKIKNLAQNREENSATFRICVDGGITYENIKRVAAAGADEVAIGASIFEGDLRQNIEKMVKEGGQLL